MQFNLKIRKLRSRSTYFVLDQETKSVGFFYLFWGASPLWVFWFHSWRWGNACFQRGSAEGDWEGENRFLLLPSGLSQCQQVQTPPTAECEKLYKGKKRQSNKQNLCTDPFTVLYSWQQYPPVTQLWSHSERPLRRADFCLCFDVSCSGQCSLIKHSSDDDDDVEPHPCQQGHV